MNKIELLAPAGDMERLQMSVAYGADAVYLAGNTFGMRTFAGNFSPEALKAAVELCRSHGVRVHVTCNTMPRNEEIACLPDWLSWLEELGVERSEDLCFYALCVARNPVAGSTVNLRCPVAINDRTRQAVQVILDTEEYQMHHLLSEFSRKKGEEQVC